MSEAVGTELPDQPRPGIGARLRQARMDKGLSARAFARSLGVSPSLISQIELDKAVPSVGTLYAVVSKLGLSLDELFFESVKNDPDSVAAPSVLGSTRPADAAETDDVVLRRADRPALALANGVRWERLTPDHDYEVDFLLVTYGMGAESCPEDALMTHSGKEYGMVLEGRLGATVGFSSYELFPGDSIAFDSVRPHRFWTIGDAPTQVLWTIVGRQGDPRFPSSRA